ncbi:hypothetical protein [Burkholderia ubonensis]|uniref:hypothetical protein n=1 Tax=Burkholderia ubonensis TaxID=101571 RepID=UPI0015816712|nr:hypothetical protein [Burkholderia ubonensis]
MKMLLAAIAAMSVSVPAYSTGTLSKGSQILPSGSHGQSEIHSVGRCSFAVDNEPDTMEYHLHYARDEYATYVTQLSDIWPIVTVSLMLGCESDNNEDLDSAMGTNENIVKSSQEGTWSLSKRAVQQKDPKLVIQNVKNGTTQGYVLMAISEETPSQSSVGFCVTNQQVVLCGSTSLSAALLHGRAMTSLVNFIQGIKLVPRRRPDTTR